MNLCLNPYRVPKSFFIFLGIISFILISCNEKEADELYNPEIVKVNRRTLKYDELLEMFPDQFNKDDSVSIANALINRWIKKEVFLSEAEKSILHIQQLNDLVKDYRESLIIHEYEEELLNQFTDTTVTDIQIQDFFDQNPDQFKLKKTILRYNLAIFPREQIEEIYNDVKTHWDKMKEGDALDIDLLKYLDLYAEEFVLDTEWHEMEGLKTKLPDAVTLSLLRKSHRLELEDEKFFYFLKIIDIAEETDEAPLSYIRTFAMKAILQKRKMEWLEKIKADLYHEAVRNNNIIMYEN